MRQSLYLERNISETLGLEWNFLRDLVKFIFYVKTVNHNFLFVLNGWCINYSRSKLDD